MARCFSAVYDASTRLGHSNVRARARGIQKGGGKKISRLDDDALEDQQISRGRHRPERLHPRVDGVDLVSVLDFIAYVCPGHNRKYATQLWNRAISNDSFTNEVVPKWHHLMLGFAILVKHQSLHSNHLKSDDTTSLNSDSSSRKPTEPTV
jgi:hypothetical protein